MFRLFNAITTMRQQYMLLIFFLAFCVQSACAQNDTVITKQMADSSIITPVPVIKDTVPKIAPADTSKKRSPAGTAALLSAIFPGAGQVYNKKYWKLPLVYGTFGYMGYWAGRYQQGYKKYKIQLFYNIENKLGENGKNPESDLTTGYLRTVVDKFRRERDFMIIIPAFVPPNERRMAM